VSRHSRPVPPPPSKPSPPSLSDSVLVGNMKLATLARTVNGYALAVVELTPAEQQALKEAGRLTVGKSQSHPEYVAPAVKSAQAALAQAVQLQKGRAA